MKLNSLKASLIFLALSLSSYVQAGLIHMQAEYSSTTTATFSWDMWLDKADLNIVSPQYQLSSSSYDFIDSLNINYTDTSGTNYVLSLNDLKTYGVYMIYYHDDSAPFVADGTNQLSKIFDINFIGAGIIDAFKSKGATDGPSGWINNTLRVAEFNGYFELASFKSVTDVPEPSTLAIFALGLLGFVSRKLKK